MGQFNRAKLLNIGYVESQHDIQWRCFTFHDVDLIPEDDRNLYTCPFNNPRHLSRGVDKFKYVLPYADIFGEILFLYFNFHLCVLMFFIYIIFIICII